MILSLFTLQTSLEVPFKLALTESSDAWMVGLGLFVSFLLIAYAQRMEPTILKGTGLTFFSASTRDDLEEHEVSMGSYGYLFLSLSFLFSFGVCLYEWLDYSKVIQLGGLEIAFSDYASWQVLLFGVCGAFAFMVYPFLGLFFGEWITGEHSVFAVARQQTWISFQFFFLLTFVIAAVWMLNPVFSPVLLSFLPWFFAFLFFVRLFKCFWMANVNGASWYYIILYFCTLEILPILFLIKWFV